VLEPADVLNQACQVAVVRRRPSLNSALREYQPSVRRRLWVLDGASPAAQVIRRHQSKNAPERGIVQLRCGLLCGLASFCRETHLHRDMLSGCILVGVFELVAHDLHSRIVCQSGANPRQNCLGRLS
jgi:hypothetical protein